MSFSPAPATLVSSPVNTTANISSSITLMCQVMASHTLTVTWRQNGNIRQTMKLNTSSTRYVSTLTFPLLLLSDTGTYSCSVSNQASQDGPNGSDVSDNFYLFVQSEFPYLYIRSCGSGMMMSSHCGSGMMMSSHCGSGMMMSSHRGTTYPAR